MSSKRNFKNVRKNREAFNTQPITEFAQAQKGTLPPKQKQMSQNERIADMISKGRAKIKAKEYNDSIKIFSEILDKFDNNNPDAIFYRAISFLDQGNLQ